MHDPGTVRPLAEDVLDEIERAVVGKREVARGLLVALLAGGHALLEDVPGVAKTQLARSLATVCGLRLSRIQMTPDLLPSDLTGSMVLDPEHGRPRFQPGPLHANLVLADEVNRAPPKTQSALLEAMQEGQVTVEGETHPLPRPFCVIATQNPVESEGTYPLPEAQLDRFLLRLSVGYPDREAETTMLTERVARRRPEPDLAGVLDGEGVLGLQAAVERVHVDATIAGYVVDLVAATRDREELLLGASPRGSLAALQAARATAALAGRDFVLPEDVQEVLVPALGHRLAIRPDRWVRGLRAERVLERCRELVPAPVTEAP